MEEKKVIVLAEGFAAVEACEDCSVHVIHECK